MESQQHIFSGYCYFKLPSAECTAPLQCIHASLETHFALGWVSLIIIIRLAGHWKDGKANGFL